MNTYDTLKKALNERTALTALVHLLNGEVRLRKTVVVAKLTETMVTFFEPGKGFRSAPLGLIEGLLLEPRMQAVADELYAFLDGASPQGGAGPGTV